MAFINPKHVENANDCKETCNKFYIFSVHGKLSSLLFFEISCMPFPDMYTFKNLKITTYYLEYFNNNDNMQKGV